MWGSNDVAYEVYINIDTGNIDVEEIGSFGDRTFVVRFEHPEHREVTEQEVGTVINNFKNMTYERFKEMIDVWRKAK